MNYQIEGWLVRGDAKEIKGSAGTVRLEPKVMEVLLHLIRHQERVVSRDELLAAVWKDTFVTEDTLTKAVSKIRQALGDSAKQPRIVGTVPKLGYRLLCPAQPVTPPCEKPLSSRSRLAGWFPGAALVLILIFFVLAFALFRPRSGPPDLAAATPTLVTSFPGREMQPDFSPDGRQIVFVRDREDVGTDLFIQTLDTHEVLQLTDSPGLDRAPRWSPDGSEIAFLRIEKGEHGLYLISVSSGVARRVRNLSTHRRWSLSWFPDGKSIAVSGRTSAGGGISVLAVSLETGDIKQLTRPGTNLYGDHFPSISPDGRHLVFFRSKNAALGSLMLLPLYAEQGEPETLASFGGWFKGLTWVTEYALIFSSDYQGRPSLRWMDIRKGEVVRFAPGLSGVVNPTYCPRTAQLAYETEIENSDIWEQSLREDLPPKMVLASTVWESTPQLSPDGTMIAFSANRSGYNEIWIADASGENPRQLTYLKSGFTSAPRWSPDGKQLAFDSRIDERVQIYTLALDGGVPKRVSDGSADDILPTWSLDGRSLYFTSNREGKNRLWQIDLASSSVAQITHHGGFLARESRDGGFLYYWQTDVGICRLDRETAEKTVVLSQPGLDWSNWEPFDEGIAFITIDEAEKARLFFQDFAAGEAHLLAELGPNVERLGVDIAADRGRVLFSRFKPSENDIHAISLR